jgi:ABC-type transport system involved in multi-copper enzyme maturation permease subunit
MSATVALQMFSADLLKLRKKISTLAWSLFFACGPVLIFFIVKVIQHSSNAAKYGPAGGLQGYRDGLRVLALFMGPLAAILIGAEAGAGDASAGVFRDLVVTGRSRVALFATRVPAALAMCWAAMIAGFAVLAAGTFIFAGGLTAPDAALILNGLGFTLLTTGVVTVVAVGFGALTTSRPATITALIGWQLVASPLIAGISSLGGIRKGILSQALGHFSPVRLGDHGADVTMSQGVALAVVAAWVLIFLALGARRTRTMDT